MGDRTASSDLQELVDKNSEGLKKLANEEPAAERREKPLKAEIKRLYRKYIKRPKAEPALL